MTGHAERTVKLEASTGKGGALPVTARLSRKFYEAIGDDAANDLVNWMNAVDATYRADLLRLNEANLDRFSTEIARHSAEFSGEIVRLRAEVDRRLVELHAEMDQRFTELRAEMDQRFTELRAEMDRRFTELRAEMDQRFTELRAEMDQRFTALDVRFSKFEARMLRWMFVFWTGTMAGAAATILAVVQAR